MQYSTDRYGRQISRLGFGCMRFTKDGSVIDYPKAEREVLFAMDLGINYFDTAYIYPGNEECIGRILHDNRRRENAYLATKLPQFFIRSGKGIDKTFRKQLARLRTDRVDFYLMHMFTDIAEWEKLRALGIEEWLHARRSEGSIGSVGFSFHGDTASFLKILNAYDWDFCQIQYNYYDEHSQAGRNGLQAAAAKGVPVVIMEPLRGGKLVNLPQKALDELALSGKDCTPAEMGLRWLWNQPEVSCVLSGMNSMAMIEENARIASHMETGSLDESDLALIERVRTILRERIRVGCTGCRYCMPCPHGVDIPGIFHYYNLVYLEERRRSARFEFARNMGMRSNPGFASQCVGCGKCEAHCPQHISIRAMLKEADSILLPLPYKAAIAAARKFMRK